MAQDPVEQNILGVQQLVGSKLNKTLDGATGQTEGVESEKVDEFTLKLDDEELLAMKMKWEANYAGYEAAINKRQDANKTFYLGRQKEGSQWVTTNGQPIGGNLLFEAEETFLPAAFQKNPDPVVFADDTTEGEKLSETVKTMLEYHAKTLALRPKLQLMVRHWSIYFIGVIKHGWDNEIQEITSEVRRPKNFVFDPNGYVDCYGDFVGWMGERITLTASKLIDLFPEHRAYIVAMADGKLGTDATYTEWWNDDYTFTTFKDKVLDKTKNPHFNYSKKVSQKDEDGQHSIVEKKGHNHFARPAKPYTFLSVFSLGETPHDDTTLIEQNIPNQRRISRRIEQIDFNLSRQNNSNLFSENNFTQETAKQAASAMANGHPVLIPSGGPIKDAVVKMDATAVPVGFFSALERDEDQLRNIFGTQGITSQPAQPGDLATAKVLDQQHDASRIAGGIGDRVLITAENVYNWWTQMYYVYYDEEHVASVLGQMKAVDYAKLSSAQLNKKLVVTAAPNSMAAHDDATIRAEGLQLFEAGALDPKTLLTRVNFPDPQKVAEQTVLYLLNPQAYMQINFPEIAQKLQEVTQGQQDPETMKAQAEIQGKQAELQMKGQEHQMDMEAKKQDMQLEVEKAQLEMRLKEIEAHQKIQLSRAEGENKLKLQEESGKQKLKQGEEGFKQKQSMAKQAIKNKSKSNDK